MRVDAQSGVPYMLSLAADVYFVCQFKTYEYLKLFFQNVQICDSAALRGRDHPDMPEPSLRPARRADGGRVEDH